MLNPKPDRVAAAYATSLDSRTPCCAIPVRVEDKAMQATRCPYCHNLWRIDLRLVSRRESPGGAESLRQLVWTLAGKVE